MSKMTGVKIMPKKNHEIKLTNEEVEKLKSITHKGTKNSARTILHANILKYMNELQRNRCGQTPIRDLSSVAS